MQNGWGSEKLSVWDLDLNETEVKQNEPSLKEVFHSGPPSAMPNDPSHLLTRQDEGNPHPLGGSDHREGNGISRGDDLYGTNHAAVVGHSPGKAQAEEDEEDFEWGQTEQNHEGGSKETAQVEEVKVVLPQSTSQMDLDLMDFGAGGTAVVQPVISSQEDISKANQLLFHQPAVEQRAMTEPEVEEPPPVPIVEWRVSPPLHSTTSTNAPAQEQSALFSAKQLPLSCIDHLIQQISPSDRSYLELHLSRRSFECDAAFYTILINYMRLASLQHTEQYAHLNRQMEVVHQIHSLTSRYTSAVEEEEEEKVLAALRKSQKLYSEVYNGCVLTERHARWVLAGEEKGLLWKMGRVLLECGIGEEMIRANASSGNPKKVFTGFCLLFMVEKVGSLGQLRSNAETLMWYYLEQVERFKALDTQDVKRIQERVDEFPSFRGYIKGLLKIGDITQMVAVLAKNSGIALEQTAATLKTAKHLKKRYSSWAQPDPEDAAGKALLEYGEMLKTSVMLNRGLYDLHGLIQQSLEAKPICGICMRLLEGRGAECGEGRWAHYACSNLAQVAQQARMHQ